MATLQRQWVHNRRLLENLSALVTICIVGMVVVVGAQSASRSMGTNIMGIKYYSSELKFVDIIRRAKPSYADKPAEPLVDRQGKLISGKSGTIVLKVGSRFPTESRYVVLFAGDGEVVFDGARVLDSTAGRIVVDVTPVLGKNYNLTIKRTSASNPVRDIHVVLAEHEQTFRTQPFYPPFVEFLKRYRVLRFMDWTQTNHSPHKEWSSRPTDATLSWGGDYGAPWETVFMLCNQVGADGWINIPHAATDDYITRLGAMARDMLDKNHKIYLELSNEVWLFTTQKEYYGGTNYQTRFSDRSVEMFKLFGAAFGDSSRLIRVFGGRIGSTGTDEKILSHNNNYKYGDALAVAPYFGSDISKLEGTSVDHLMQLCEQDVNTRQVERMAAVAAVCKQFGMRMVAYEGGQHVVKQNEDILIPFNRDERLYNLYVKHLTNWKNAGGDIFCHFSTIGEHDWFGGWGVMEYMGQPYEECPKLRAIDAFMHANPVWWDEPGVGVQRQGPPGSEAVRDGVRRAHGAVVLPGRFAANAGVPQYSLQGRFLGSGERSVGAAGVLVHPALR